LSSFNFYVQCAIWMRRFYFSRILWRWRDAQHKTTTKLKRPSNDNLYNKIYPSFLSLFLHFQLHFFLTLRKIRHSIVFCISKMHISIGESIYGYRNNFLLVFRTHILSLLNTIKHWHVVSFVLFKITRSQLF